MINTLGTNSSEWADCVAVEAKVKIPVTCTGPTLHTHAVKQSWSCQRISKYVATIQLLVYFPFECA